MKKKVTTIFMSVVLFALAFTGTAFATTISKTFEFGPGTQYSSSVFRTYPVPCGWQVNAVVKFKRLGPAGTNNDFPIIIELREPETAPNQEGPLVDAKSATATPTEQTVKILSATGGNTRGCNLPWRIRVKHANGGSPPHAVSGTARLDYDGNPFGITVSIGSILKGASKTVNVGDATRLLQGRIQLRPSWVHEIFGVPAGGGENIVLRFQLMDPSGTVVKTTEGHSDKGSTLPDANLYYDVKTCVSGQWKLKITNTNNKDDASVTCFDCIVTPGC